MVPTKLDHCVIHVTDWERSNAFYTTVLGAELVARPDTPIALATNSSTCMGQA
jgi:catechol 2,3-dioxygenase-like lactoylglutathione lyase family enzyme